ncbi:hypothetical protein D918_03229 [Trichuris suis]|nr:hypothetical protein D918_03229 [Trichuris suis]
MFVEQSPIMDMPHPHLLIDFDMKVPVAVGYPYPMFRNGNNSCEEGYSVYTLAQVLVPGYRTKKEGVLIRAHRNVLWKDTDSIELPFSSLVPLENTIPIYRHIAEVSLHCFYMIRMPLAHEHYGEKMRSSSTLSVRP